MGLGVKKSKDDDTTDFQNRFAFLAETLSDMAGREGLRTRPFASPSLPYFSKLSAAEKARALEQLETMVSVATRLQSQGGKICQSKALVWSYMGHMRFTGPSDLQNFITNDNEAVDIYNTHHQLIFANLTFFKYCTYSLEEHYCRPWFELYERENSGIQRRLMEMCDELAAGRHHSVVDVSPIGLNRVVEVASPELRSFDLQPKICSPLFRGGKVVAYLWVNEIAG